MRFWFLALILAGCGSFDLGGETADEVEVNVLNPTWDNGIGNLVQAKCANCHTANRSQFVPANTPADWDNIADEAFFTTTANLNDIEDKVFNNTSSPMPPEFATPLTSTERQALQTFISNQ